MLNSDKSFYLDEAKRRLDAAERELQACKGWLLLGGVKISDLEAVAADFAKRFSPIRSVRR